MRPKAELGDYKGLEVGREEPEVPEDAVEGELERLREGFARLDPVERAASGGRRPADRLRRHGGRRAVRGGRGPRLPARARRRPLLEGFEEALAGAKAGDQREVEVNFPDDYRAEDLPGKKADFTSRSRRCARRSCPTSTTTSPPRPPSSTRSTSSATTIAAADRGRTRPQRPRRLPRARRSTPPSRGDGRPARGARHARAEEMLGPRPER